MSTIISDKTVILTIPQAIFSNEHRCNQTNCNAKQAKAKPPTIKLTFDKGNICSAHSNLQC